MKIIQIDLSTNYEDKLQEISDHLSAGKTIVYPTDTCYGIAVDPTNKDAMDRLFVLKNRPHDKNISCIFSGIEQVSLWAKLNETQKHILEKNLPGAFTFILEAKTECPIRQLTVGVRVPNFEFTMRLSEITHIPYSATSANIGGMPSCYKIENFLEQMSYCGLKPAVSSFAQDTIGILSERKSINGIYPDLIIDAGELPQNQPSTVVDLTKQNPVIVRQGSGILNICHPPDMP